MRYWGFISLVLVIQWGCSATQEEGRNIPEEFHAIVADGSRKEAIEAYLDRGIDPDVRSEDDRTPLMTAARYGKYQSIEVLLKRGADVHAQDDGGFTALGYLISSVGLEYFTSQNWLKDRNTCLGSLLRAGADPTKHIPQNGHPGSSYQVLAHLSIRNGANEQYERLHKRYGPPNAERGYIIAGIDKDARSMLSTIRRFAKKRREHLLPEDG